jgi:2-polyprenyl-3-methyl-5-hydroxy-6-metoxy-1,4-benzoquinol methylase
MNTHQNEIAAGERFQFGDNWARFITILTDERIKIATESLKTMLEVEDLNGKSFLDIGSGSGLFSLAARRLGAKVFSFDYDPQSVGCTRELKRRYFENDPEWQIEEGSALETAYLGKLGKFDIVYSWGVLHHTGDMWAALKNVDGNVVEDGRLFIAIYNDQGLLSRLWLKVKKSYIKNPWARPAIVFLFWPYLVGARILVRAIRGKPLGRGMSIYFDMLDWLGGNPLEVAKPEEIFDFYFRRNYSLMKLKTCAGRMGCNEFLFRRHLNKD